VPHPTIGAPPAPPDPVAALDSATGRVAEQQGWPIKIADLVKL
jgi:hypothetical protein